MKPAYLAVRRLGLSTLRVGLAVYLSWLAATLVGCSDSGTNPDPSGPALVISPDPLMDTISGDVNVRVEVLGPDGQPLPGAKVEVSVSEGWTDSIAWLSEGKEKTEFPTNASGYGTTRLYLGEEVGGGSIQVSVHGQSLTRTVPFTVLPGRQAYSGIWPKDTAIVLGGRYQLRSGSFDRNGHQLTVGAMTINSSSDHVSASDGGWVEGLRIGRGTVQVVGSASQDIVQTVSVSVVPKGRIIAYDYPNGFTERPGRLIAFRSDGSDAHLVVEESAFRLPLSYAGGMHPAFDPRGGRIAYFDAFRLMVLDETTGLVTELFSGDPAIDEEYGPEYSLDGEWLYFSRGSTNTEETLWRIPSGGGAPELLSPDPMTVDMGPSPNPTGDFLVFERYRGASGSVHVLDLVQGTESSVNEPGQFPKWSLDGERIVFQFMCPGGGFCLYTMKPDGTDVRLVGNGVKAHTDFSWAIGSEWLLVSGPLSSNSVSTGLSFVNAETGESIPILRNWEFLLHPAFFPDPEGQAGRVFPGHD